MFDFRKVLLAVAVAGFGLVGSASAQSLVTLSGYVINSSNVRVEGTTEQLQQQQVYMYGTPGTSSVKLTITSNAAFTNQLLTGTTSSETDAYGVFTQGTGAAKYVVGVLSSTNTLTFSIPVTANVALQQSGFAVTATAAAPAIFSITNLRVNANAAGPATTAITTTLGAGTGSIINLTSGAVTQSAAVSAASLSYSFYGYPNTAVCAVKVTDLNAVGVIKVSPTFIGALSTDPGEANTGAGIAAPPVGFTFPTGDSLPSAANFSPRIALTFGNLASGVNYYLPQMIVNGAFTMTLVGSATGQTALTATTIASTTTETNPVGGNVTAVVVVPFTATNGAFTAYYQVTGLNGTSGTASPLVGASSYAAPEQVSPATAITLWEVTTATAVGASGAPTVAASLAGTTTGYEVLATQTPSAKAATPYTTTTITGNPSTDQGVLGACSTTLLFPYLISGYAGYNTGIDIANASAGTSVTGNTVTSSAGTCTLNLYGSINGTALATPIAVAPGAIKNAAGTDALTIAAGNTSLFLLNAVQYNSAPLTGYVGYGVATCTFQEGHGFALTTDGIGDSNGYLAAVLGDIFNQGALAINTPF
jgi:hypothetical protein